MCKFGLTKRCGCPRRAWTNGCPHSWHYKFKWKGRRYRAALDDVLDRHVSGKSEALEEVEKIYDAVRDGTFGRESAATLTLRQLGERYFKAYVSPTTGRLLGRNERYRWNVMIQTKVHGRPLSGFASCASSSANGGWSQARKNGSEPSRRTTGSGGFDSSRRWRPAVASAKS